MAPLDNVPPPSTLNSPAMPTHLILASNADCGRELGHIELQATDLLTELWHSVVHLALQTLHRLQQLQHGHV